MYNYDRRTAALDKKELAKYVRAVKKALTDELRSPKYRGRENPLAGHCYVASEALYHLLGGKEAGWKPMSVRHEGEPHWFLKHESGLVVDATESQFQEPVPVCDARGKGFLTKQPSKRAQIVIDRVRAKVPAPPGI